MKRIIAGSNAVTEALNAAPSEIEIIYLAEGLKPKVAANLLKLSKANNCPVESVARQHIDKIAKDLNHQGVLAITGSFSFLNLETLLQKTNSDNSLIVVLDQIQDPGNLGAIIRSSYALGATGIIITKDRSATMTAVAVRASAGASELIKMARVTNLARCLNHLKNEGYRVYGAAAEAKTKLHQADWSGKIAMVLGNEGKGLRRLTRENCDDLFAIPLSGKFDSLNVSAAAAISLYEASKTRMA